MPTTSSATRTPRPSKSESPLAAELDALLAEYGSFVTRPQAATLLNVSPRTLGRLTAAGDLPMFQVGRARSYRYRVADLVKLMRQVA